MTVLEGRKYLYQINKDFIYLVPRTEEIKTVSIESRLDEDFSIYDLGPEICKETEMGIQELVIEDVGIYNNCFMRIAMPNPGNNIEIIIYNYDGSEVLHITDIIEKYNRGTDTIDNYRSATEDDAEFVDNPAPIGDTIDIPDDTGEETKPIEGDDSGGGSGDPGSGDDNPGDEHHSGDTEPLEPNVITFNEDGTFTFAETEAI